MNGRRVFYLAGACVVAAAILVAVFVTGNMAQEGMMVDEGAMAAAGTSGAPSGAMIGEGTMGMGGMGGGMGGGGGAAMTHEEVEVPEHLRMTYDQFLAENGLPRVPIPSAYIVDDAGEPKQLSANEWHQLYRIYREGVVAIEVERGRPGGRLADQISAELDHIRREHVAMVELYQYACEHCFSAEIGYPMLGSVGAGADTVDVRVNVILKATRDFPTLVEKRLTPLSKPGWPIRDSSSPGARIGSAAGRERFDFITRQGGFTKPVKLYLDSGAIGLWNRLWSDTRVRVSLLDANDEPIAEQETGAGLNGGSITQQMVFPAYAFQHTQVHRMPDVSPWGTKLPLFNGTTRSMYEIKGWLIGGADGMRFSLPTGALATLNGAQVELVPGQPGPQDLDVAIPFVDDVLLRKVRG